MANILFWEYLEVRCFRPKNQRDPATLSHEQGTHSAKIVLIVECVCRNVKSWIKSWVIYLTFKSHALAHTLNCICVSLFKFRI